MFKKLLITVLISASVGACRLTTEPATSHFGSGPRKILFIGNSLTYVNDMPSMVVALADAAKLTPALSADVWASPDYALIDHWQAGAVRKLVADGHYDVVVLQQGPSSVSVNRDTLRLAAKLFDPVIRAAGGIPALYSVWPTIDRQQDFDRATESYQLAAGDVKGMHFPGGETWRAAWRKDGGLRLYSSDGLHPSTLGSYAVALSIVGMLYDRSVVGLPNVLSVDTATVRLLQQAADEANKQFGSKGAR
jgi:hypothetical protein